MWNKKTEQNEAIIEGLICLLKLLEQVPWIKNDEERKKFFEAKEKYRKSTIKLLELANDKS